MRSESQTCSLDRVTEGLAGPTVADWTDVIVSGMDASFPDEPGSDTATPLCDEIRRRAEWCLGARVVAAMVTTDAAPDDDRIRYAGDLLSDVVALADRLAEVEWWNRRARQKLRELHQITEVLRYVDEIDDHAGAMLDDVELVLEEVEWLADVGRLDAIEWTLDELAAWRDASERLTARADHVEVRRPIPRTLSPPGQTITAQPLSANAPPAVRVRVAA